MNKRTEKIRNFACLLYLDSYNYDFVDVLNDTGLQYWYILHDKDMKKPHYHVYIHAENPISSNTVNDIINKIGAANGEYKKVVSQVGYLRYLTHMDSPEKHQYNAFEVKCGNGAAYTLTETTRTEDKPEVENKLMLEMIDYIDTNNVYLYCDFVRHCLQHRKDWFNVLISPRGRVIDKYIKSLYWALNHN